MPSLAEKMEANKKKLVRGPGGQLVEEGQESIQDLTTKAGLPVPPITPVGQAGIGANPDQMKMAGTPAQKDAAIQIAQAPTENLQDVMRRQQVRTEAIAPELQKIEKSENLKNLGGLGDRVNDFINAQRTKLVQQSVGLQTAETAQKVSGGAADMATLKPLLQQLQADPSNMELQLQVNRALGYDASRQLSPAEVSGLYRSAVDSIAQSGAETIDNDLNVDDLTQTPEFGYDKQQLSELLGVPLEQVGSMNIGQIREQVNKLIADEFSSTAQLEQQAQSGQLGAAERGAARQAARESSAVGTRSSEADVANLEDQIAKAENVSFGGKQMGIEELLSDDTISSTISEYMSAGPDSPIRKQLEKSEPQLVDFINRNQKVIADAVDTIGAGASQFQQLQKSNLEKATVGGLLDKELATKLIPQIGELSAEALDPSKVPVLAAAQSLTADQKRNYTQTLQSLTTQFPNSMEDLKGLNADQIKQLDLGNPNGKWKNYERDQQRYKEIMDTPDDQILELITKAYGTQGNFEEDMKQNAAVATLGLAKPNASLKLVDADGDGKPDSAADIKARLVKGQPTLADTLAGKSKVTGPVGYEPPDAFPEYEQDILLDDTISGKKDAVRASLAQTLGKAAADGRLDPGEIGNAFKPGKPDDMRGQVNELSYLLDRGDLTPETRKTVEVLIDRNQRVLTDDYLRSGPFSPSKLTGDIKDILKRGSTASLDFVGQRDRFPAVLDNLQNQIRDLETQSKTGFYKPHKLAEKVDELKAIQENMKKVTSDALERYIETQVLHTGALRKDPVAIEKAEGLRRHYINNVFDKYTLPKK